MAASRSRKPAPEPSPPKRDLSGKVLYVVLGEDTMTELDACITELNASVNDGREWTRSIFVRKLVRDGIAAAKRAQTAAQ